MDIIIGTNGRENIVDMVNKNPGITQKELAEKIKIKQQNISYNLLKLVEKNQIKISKTGKNKKYYTVET